MKRLLKASENKPKLTFDIMENILKEKWNFEGCKLNDFYIDKDNQICVDFTIYPDKKDFDQEYKDYREQTPQYYLDSDEYYEYETETYRGWKLPWNICKYIEDNYDISDVESFFEV